MEENMKRMSLFAILKSSWVYCQNNKEVFGLFSIVNYLFMAIAVYLLGGWSHPAFLLLAVFMYLFWSFFFRFYFQKKPYFQMKPIMRSLIPSTKIVFITVVVFLALFLLVPFAPLMVGVPYVFEGYTVPYVDKYLIFLQKYMQDSHVMDWVLNLPLILIMPLILYRPFLAWIAALMGRRGSLRIAWQKTKGNYRQFVLMALIMNVPFMFLNEFAEMSPWFSAAALIIASPLFVFFNIMIAQVYDFFYQD